MKDKIYYTFFFSALIIVIIAGNLYQMNFPYWLFAIAAFLIIAYLKDVFTGLGWFQKAVPQPIYNPGITESAYQEIVAGYPDLNEVEKNGYKKLSTLCVGSIHQDKVSQFISSLKDYSNDIDGQSTLSVVMDFSDDNDIHFIMGLDGRSAIEDLEWRIKGALKQNFDREINLPKETDYPSNASVSYENVFMNFDIPLRKEGFQIGFINEGSDSYIIIVHKTDDKNDIVQSVSQMGYPYYDCTKDTTDPGRIPAFATPPQKFAPKKNHLIIYIFILLLCPVFSYAIYKGYLKEGFSKNVVMISVCNLIFYWFSIYRIISTLKTNKKKV